MEISRKQRKYVMTPEEQNEYVQKIQQGKINIPEDQLLESEAAANLRELGARIHALTNSKNRAEKEVEERQRAIQKAEADINAISGEMAAYASMLVSAEDHRRSLAMKTDGEPIAPDDPNAAVKALRGKDIAVPTSVRVLKGKEDLSHVVPPEVAKANAEVMKRQHLAEMKDLAAKEADGTIGDDEARILKELREKYPEANKVKQLPKKKQKAQAQAAD